MIRLKESTRASLMAMHAFAMLVLGMGLFYIRAGMTNRLYYIFGCIFAIFLVAELLILIAVLDWIGAVGRDSGWGSRRRGLLFLSTAAAASALFLALYPNSTVRILCYIIAAHAFLLGIGKFRLAGYWIGTRREHTVVYLIATITLLFSAVLLAAAGRDERDVLAVIGLYSLFIGLQMLLSMVYLQRARMDATSLPR